MIESKRVQENAKITTEIFLIQAELENDVSAF